MPSARAPSIAGDTLRIIFWIIRSARFTSPTERLAHSSERSSLRLVLDGDLLDLARLHALVASNLDAGELLDDSVRAALAEDRVFPVQVLGRRVGDEELLPVGVGAAIGHAQKAALV